VVLCIALALAKPQKPQKPQTDCDICKTLIIAIESWLEANKTMAQIETDLDLVCQLAPPFAPVCEQFVAWGVPDIVNYIKTNEDPTTFCNQAGICATKSQPKIVKPKDVNCYMCTYVIQSMESWLEQNATVNQIEQNLDQLCALIPGFESQCDAIVAQEVPQIIQWIEQNQTPDQICSQLGFCNSTRLIKQQKPRDANCFICETIISSVEQWVENNSTEQQIEQYLDTLCALVPAFQAQCDSVIASGLTQILQWIEQNETPQQICTNLGLCTNGKVHSGRPKIFNKAQGMTVKF